MKELSTIQKIEKLNAVYAVDKKGNGGANHEYVIRASFDGCIQDLANIKFQDGARKEENNQHGIIDSDLLEIVRDRLKSFQDGPFASHYNEHALKHIEEALHCMNARVEDRIKRNVLGTNNK